MLKYESIKKERLIVFDLLLLLAKYSSKECQVVALMESLSGDLLPENL